MYYQQNLRVQLQQRRNRIYKAVQETYGNELKYLLRFIEQTPYLEGLVKDLEAQRPEIEWQSWREEHFGNGTFVLPDNEVATAKLCCVLIRECSQNCATAWRIGSYVNNERNTNAALRDFTEVFVDPFVNYLHDRVGEGSNVLYLLEKYKHRIEWFRRDELLGRMQADTKHSESIADADLREYLFDQGIDYPFSTPTSPSGRADIVADVGEEKPLVLEIKLFDPERGYGCKYVRQGFRQVHDYANDYGQSVGYLVVFNCTPLALKVQTQADTKQWPPRITLGHQTFFVVVVDLVVPDESASKRGPPKPYVITEEYLTSQSEAAAPPDQ